MANDLLERLRHCSMSASLEIEDAIKALEAADAMAEAQGMIGIKHLDQALYDLNGATEAYRAATQKRNGDG